MKKTALISIAVVAFDQIIKKVITSKLVLGESISIIKNILNITYVTNTGAAFSILSSNTYFLIMISLIVLTVLVLYLIKVKTDNNEKTIYGFLIGGIIGNLIDRIIYGSVIDFIDFRIFNYNYPIFNIADSAIVIGVIILIITSIKRK